MRLSSCVRCRRLSSRRPLVRLPPHPPPPCRTSPSRALSVMPPAAGTGRNANPLRTSPASPLSGSELDAVVRSVQQQRAREQTQEAAVAALREQLRQEEETDALLSRQSLLQRIGLRLSRRQLGWKVAAVTLGFMSCAASMQLLLARRKGDEQRAAEEAEAAERRLQLQQAQDETAAVCGNVSHYLNTVRARLEATPAASSAELSWLSALQRRVSSLSAASAENDRRL